MTERLLVCGGRGYDDRATAFLVMDHIRVTRGIAMVIHGACPIGGADELAHAWCYVAGVPVAPVPPDADLRDDPSAGPRRNRLMLTKWRPTLVLAFAGGKGTLNMKAAARDAGVPVLDAADVLREMREGGE